MRVNRTLLRGRASLTESAADLVSLCTPSAKELLGMWLEDMAEIFCKRHTLWKKDREACKQAEVIIPVQQSKCKIAASVLNEWKQQCDRELDRAESFSCSWATGFATRCLSYDTCFASVLERHSDAVREANESVVRWRKSWLAASRMECMADAMDDSGVHDTKLHACNCENITNMAFIVIVVPEPPSKVVCPSLENFPGSALYHIEVRQPTSCEWSAQAKSCEGQTNVKSTSPVLENHHKNGYENCIYSMDNIHTSNEDKHDNDTNYINKHKYTNHDTRKLHTLARHIERVVFVVTS